MCNLIRTVDVHFKTGRTRSYTCALSVQLSSSRLTLRKHANINILKILQTKKKKKKKQGKFSDTKSDILNIPAQNIECGHSLEPPR